MLTGTSRPVNRSVATHCRPPIFGRPAQLVGRPPLAGLQFRFAGTPANTNIPAGYRFSHGTDPNAGPLSAPKVGAISTRVETASK